MSELDAPRLAVPDTVLRSGDKVFQHERSPSLVKARIPDRPIADTEQPLINWFILTRTTSLFILTLALAAGGAGISNVWLKTIVGGLLPPLVWMIWFSESVGGTSVDRCQLATVFLQVLIFTIIWLLIVLSLPFQWDAMWASFYFENESECCNPYVRVGNQTKIDQLKHAPICLCPLSAFLDTFSAPLPEEIFKYIAISTIAARSIVVDPIAVVSMSLIAGGGFALTENVLFIYLQKVSPITRFLFPFPMHCVCQMVMGVFIAKRKFIDKNTRVNCGSCWTDPKWFFKVLSIPLLIHGVHNFIAKVALKSTAPVVAAITFILLFAHLTAWFVFLRTQYILLNHVPRVNLRRLQKQGWLDTGVSYFCCLFSSSHDPPIRNHRIESIYEMAENGKFSDGLNDGYNGGVVEGESSSVSV